jgi:dihydrodipicolinate synthase/N-acetylneuraminate lyase
MAAAFPDVVRSALDAADDAAAERLAALRIALDANGKLIAAAKHVLGQRGLSISPSVRAPLQPLTVTEAADLDETLSAFLAPTAA